MQTKEEILSILKRLKNEIHSKYKVKNIGLFGSYVNNMQKEKSDIDLLVEFDDEADLLHFMGLTLFLERYFDKNIDLVSKFALKEELREDILKEVIYA
jgi:predicted nucleotidyltransferase